MLYIHDPKAMHHIAVKDMDIFEEATWFTRYESLSLDHLSCLIDCLSSVTRRVFGPGLFATNGIPTSSRPISEALISHLSIGDNHRKQRKILNPVFSINHMRHMMPIFYNVTHQVSLHS